MPTLVRAHQALWPDWEMRIHHDQAFEHHPYFQALVPMHGRGLLRLMYCGSPQALCDAMLWRLLPAFEGDDKVVLTADVDSLPMLKLRLCVDEWRASGKSFMVVHDCESDELVRVEVAGAAHRVHPALGQQFRDRDARAQLPDPDRISVDTML